MNKAKVLIVEDESVVALEMKRSLESFDFEVTNTAKNYNTAINSIRINKPDIILMDINLKNSKDGIETVKKIHQTNKIPVIYITAFSDENTINRAIETNPVSYLMKPFNREELKSNILLGLYKSSQEKKEPTTCKEYYSIGLDYFYDKEKRKLYYKNLPINLGYKESLLLELLINAKGEIVTFEQLEEEIWPSGNMSKSSLRTLIYRLRSKVEYKLIETKSKVGCKLTQCNKEKRV